MSNPLTILDGAMGTELGRLGIDLSGREWSARALMDRPDLVSEVHGAYVAAGATVHTTNTFRTKRRDVGGSWEELTRRAVDVVRVSVPASHRVAGSLSPLEDCYRPDLSPGERSRGEHGEMARTLAAAGADLILCETFPMVQEALIAVEEGVTTGLETWVSFTPGPRGDLMSEQEMASGAREAISCGASAVLVNCVAATRALPFVRALVDSVGVRGAVGVYANAGTDAEGIGWGELGEEGPQLYADLALHWIEAGASIVGGCCGTRAAHIAAIARPLSSR